MRFELFHVLVISCFSYCKLNYSGPICFLQFTSIYNVFIKAREAK